MHYQFPTIHNLNDILPHIQNREEFRVVDKKDYIVANYMVAFEDTFMWDDSDILGSSIRREIRGLIFDSSENLISRPFHKFFNCNEREETQISKINLNLEYHIQEKLDGSLIRFIKIQDNIKAATKSGITDISQQVDEYLRDNPEYYEFINFTINSGLTACFEWCSRKNRVVLDYPEDKLILTTIRNTISGKYLSYLNMFELVNHYNIPAAKTIENDFSNQSIEFIVNQIRDWKNKEGIVITFSDGHRIKIKADEYVLFHKVKDQLNQEKNVISAILNDEVDDILPILSESDAERLILFRKIFWVGFFKVYKQIIDLYNSGEEYETEKDFAIHYVNKLDPKYRAFLFGKRKGENLKKIMLNKIKKSLNNQTKINEVRWLWNSHSWN